MAEDRNSKKSGPEVYGYEWAKTFQNEVKTKLKAPATATVVTTAEPQGLDLLSAPKWIWFAGAGLIAFAVLR